MKPFATLHKTLLALHSLDKDLRVSTALVLIEIARQEPHGCTVSHLMQALNMAQPAVQRALQRLSDRGSSAHSVGEPLGFIVLEDDYSNNRRRHLARLSKAGAEFLVECH